MVSPRRGSDTEKYHGRKKLCSASRRFHDVIERTQSGARRVDEHRHVAGRMTIGAHQLVRVRDLVPGKHLAHAGIDAPIEHELVCRRGLLEMREVRALDALLPHPHIAGVESDVVAGGAGAEHHHAAALHHQARYRERRLAGMLEHDVYVALAGDVPDRLAELAGFLGPLGIFRRIHRGHLAPALEILAVDHALGAEAEHVVALALVRDDADRVSAGRGRKLHAEHAQAPGGTPDQHIVAGLQGVRRVAVQHAIGGRERERVASRLLPGEVRGLLHQLARLHAAELRERAVRRLVAPDALRGREQRVAAVAVLVVAVVLIAVNDDFIADLPAPHLGAAGPHDARGIGAGDVEWILVHVERRDRNAEAGPNTVVVDATGHHVDQHLVLADRPSRQHLALHRGFRRTVALLADRPGVHLRRHVAERRDFADLVKILGTLLLWRVRLQDNRRHGRLLPRCNTRSGRSVA